MAYLDHSFNDLSINKNRHTSNHTSQIKMATSAVEVLNKTTDWFVHKFPAFPNMLISRLNEQRLKSSLCDAKVITKEGAVFYAHKAVLAACSPYLEAELTSPENSKTNMETVITLGMVSSISFQALLDLVYTAKLRLSPETVGEILLAADILDLDKVGEICRQYLRSQIKSVSKQRHTTASESSTEQQDSGISNEDEKLEKENDNVKPVRWSSDDALYSNADKENKSLKRRILNWLELSEPQKIKSVRPASAPSSLKSHDYDSSEHEEEISSKRRKKHYSADHSADIKHRDNNENDILTSRSRVSESTDEHTDIEIFPNHDTTLRKLSHDRDSEADEIDIINHDDDVSNEQERSNFNLADNLNDSEPLDLNANNAMPQSKYFQMIHENTMPTNSSNNPFPSNTALIKSIYAMQSRANSGLQMIDFPTSNRQVLQQSNPNLSQQTHVGTSCFRCNICRLDFGTEWAYSMHQRLYHQFHRDYLSTQRDIQTAPQRSHSFSARTEISPVPVPRLLFQENAAPSPPMPHPIIEFAKEFNDTAADKDKHTSHICYHCNKSFSTVMELRKHKASEHVKRPFKCDKCGSAFPNKAGLSVHLRSHTGERPYKCKVCNKAFTQLGHVQRHQKVHTGEKPYQCPLCHARVRDKASMHYHILAHKGVKPFKCDQCDARFTKRSSLVKHKNVSSAC